MRLRRARARDLAPSRSARLNNPICVGCDMPMLYLGVGERIVFRCPACLACIAIPEDSMLDKFIRIMDGIIISEDRITAERAGKGLMDRSPVEQGIHA